MNIVKKNRIAILARIAFATIGVFFVAAFKNEGLTLNVIVFPLIYIAISIRSNSPIIYSEMD